MSFGPDIPLFPWNRTPAPKAEPATPQTTRSDQSDWLTQGGYTPKGQRTMASTSESSKTVKIPLTTILEGSFDDALKTPPKNNSDPETPRQGSGDNPDNNPEDDPDDPQREAVEEDLEGHIHPHDSTYHEIRLSNATKQTPKIKHKLAEAADFAGWVRSLKMCLYEYDVDEEYTYGDLVEGDLEVYDIKMEIDGITQKIWIRATNFIMMVIRNNCEEAPYRIIRLCDTGAEAYKKLRTHYENKIVYDLGVVSRVLETLLA